jgi:secreted Zn-dependent insulinase-like peptidase
LVRGWQNSKLTAPYTYLPGALRNALYTPYWDEDGKLAAVESLRPRDLEAYRKEFLAGIRVDALIYGNTSRQQARALAQQLEPLLLGSKGGDLPGIELTLLDEGERWRYPLALEHDDAAIVYYVQGKSDDNHQRVLMGLTGQIIQTPYYQSLRTEQQLGYVVYAATTVLERWPGLSFTVQSPVTDSASLVKASEELITQFGSTVDAMQQVEFDKHRSALVSLINRPHKNLYSEAGYFWDQVLQDYQNFDRREQLTQALQQLQLKQWQDFYRDNFLPLPRRALVVTQEGAQKSAPGAWADKPVIGTVKEFKRAHPQQAYP